MLIIFHKGISGSCISQHVHYNIYIQNKMMKQYILLSITFYVVIYAYNMYGKGVNYKLYNGYDLLEIKSLGNITPDQPKS